MISRRLALGFLALSLCFAAPVRFARADDASAQGDDAKPAPKAKKKGAKKKKTFDYDRSKYKSLAPESGTSYKFNEKGEPLAVGAKKKSSVKKKKRAEPPDADSPQSGSCGSDESCSEKKSEADAL